MEQDRAARPAGSRPCSDPPKIIYSMTPAVLALIDGQPVLQPSAENFQKVVNTRSLIIYDPKKYTYYLAMMDGWMDSPTVEGLGRSPNMRRRKISTRSSRVRWRAI